MRLLMVLLSSSSSSSSRFVEGGQEEVIGPQKCGVNMRFRCWSEWLQWIQGGQGGAIVSWRLRLILGEEGMMVCGDEAMEGIG